ncbi:MAG: tetratricopeptide repeat protein [Bacteroidota bacterium]
MIGQHSKNIQSKKTSIFLSAMNSSYDIKDFNLEVIEASFQVPVVVDFWAEWCGPCKVLGPLLEELAQNANGAWKLAKLNTEEFPDLAKEFGIRGIPAVKMFVEGKSVDEFVGALPKYQVEYWLQKALPSRYRKDILAAEYLAAEGKPDEAMPVLEIVLQNEPENIEARVMLARLALFNDPKRAGDLLEKTEEPLYGEQIESIRAMSRLLVLKTDPSALPDSPGRPYYINGIEALAKQDFDAALRAFIDVLKEDRYYDDDGPRKACIAIFKYLGEEHELSQKYRREFSSALYV